MKKNTLNRKDFLIKSGMVFTVPLFLKYCSSAMNVRQPGKKGNDPLLNADAENYSDPILKAINTGITAPNPHNTQAWKFRILNSTEMLLYVDEKRILPATDPPARQIHIGQGTFLEHLKIGAKQIGYDSQIQILPEGDYTLGEIGKKPVAQIKLVQSPVSGHILFNSLNSRATNRSIYSGNFITEQELKNIMEIGKTESCNLSFIITEKEMKPFKEIFYQAMKIEMTTFRTNDESRIWFRFSDEEIYSLRDGISLPGNGVTGLKRWIAETFFISSDPDKFHDKSGTEAGLSMFQRVVDSTKGFVFFRTETNTKKDWILAGMDYARFHLATTHAALQLSPLSQILQEFPEMEKLKNRFEELTLTKSPAKIQMIARLGRSNYRFFAPRRSLKDMIVT